MPIESDRRGRIRVRRVRVRLRYKDNDGMVNLLEQAADFVDAPASAAEVLESGVTADQEEAELLCDAKHSSEPWLRDISSSIGHAVPIPLLGASHAGVRPV